MATNAIVIPAKLILVVSNWLTVATITPNYNGETNFNSSTVWIQRAEWFQKEIEITLTDDGRYVEGESKINKINISQPDSAYTPGRPFWSEGYLWQFIPTNVPPALSVIPFRFIKNRQDMPPMPVPPLPPK